MTTREEGESLHSGQRVRGSLEPTGSVRAAGTRSDRKKKFQIVHNVILSCQRIRALHNEKHTANYIFNTEWFGTQSRHTIQAYVLIGLIYIITFLLSSYQIYLLIEYIYTSFCDIFSFQFQLQVHFYCP